MESLLPILIIAGIAAFILTQQQRQQPGGNDQQQQQQPPQVPVWFAEGRYVKGSDRTIYKIEGGVKRRFQDWFSFIADGGARDLSNVWTVQDLDLAKVPDGPPMPIRRPAWFANGTFIKGTGQTIYRMENGCKRRIPDWQTFVALAGTTDWARVVVVVPESDLQLVCDGPPYPSAGPTYYLFQR